MSDDVVAKDFEVSVAPSKPVSKITMGFEVEESSTPLHKWFNSQDIQATIDLGRAVSV